MLQMLPGVGRGGDDGDAGFMTSKPIMTVGGIELRLPADEAQQLRHVLYEYKRVCSNTIDPKLYQWVSCLITSIELSLEGR